tara:strand:- start:930 stop:1085 length:156 start_codon:yes stop_codon:yes gene_type:complete
MNNKEKRILRTGYELSAEQLANLSLEEQEARKKQMLESREELRRLKEIYGN